SPQNLRQSVRGSKLRLKRIGRLPAALTKKFLLSKKRLTLSPLRSHRFKKNTMRLLPKQKPNEKLLRRLNARLAKLNDRPRSATLHNSRRSLQKKPAAQQIVPIRAMKPLRRK